MSFAVHQSPLNAESALIISSDCTPHLVWAMSLDVSFFAVSEIPILVKFIIV